MSIKKLPDGRYEWRHRVGGRHLKKVFARRSDAVAHDSKIRRDLALGAHVDMTNKTTVAEYFRQWVDDRVLRASTVAIRTTILRVHLEPLPLGSRPLVKVKPSEIQAWARSRAGVLGPRTLRRHVSVLRSMFATAVLDGLIARNPVQPASRLSLPKLDEPKLVPLTIGQVLAWADQAPAHVRAAILAQAGLGLRISELLALRVQDIDFMRRLVHVDEQLDRYGGGRVPLKTGNSRRKVPLPSVTSLVISEHIRQFPPGRGGLIFTPVYTEFRSNGLRNNAPHQRANGTWPQNGAGKAYREAARAAGLPAGTSSHDLRHHYASVLLDAGESVHAVAERLGDTAAMVLSVYGHLMPDREDTTRKAVDAAWSAAGNQAAEGTL